MGLVEEALVLFRGHYKFWLIKAQLQESTNLIEEARATYEEALVTEGVKSERQVWLSFADFEARHLALTKARTILQKARIRMPADDLIWLASARLEVRSENSKIALNLVSQAL